MDIGSCVEGGALFSMQIGGEASIVAVATAAVAAAAVPSSSCLTGPSKGVSASAAPPVELCDDIGDDVDMASVAVAVSPLFVLAIW